MRIVTTIRAMRDARAVCHGEVGFVPTMGAIHEGHLSLVHAARIACEHVVASIFVNPLQFGSNEDLAKYPRTFERDCELFEEAGVDILFAPPVEEMYPQQAVTTVEVAAISDRLDGGMRPGHFRGVATVVTKLFNLVQPALAYFGQKDAAQVAVLKAMVRDLNIPVRLQVCPTVREPDGLAMSSRNRYLSTGERTKALAIVRALRSAYGQWSGGVSDAAMLKSKMRDVLLMESTLQIEYAEVVDPQSLLPIDRVNGEALLAIAARIGSTRLIDNMLIGDNQ